MPTYGAQPGALPRTRGCEQATDAALVRGCVALAVRIALAALGVAIGLHAQVVWLRVAWAHAVVFVGSALGVDITYEPGDPAGTGGPYTVLSIPGSRIYDSVSFQWIPECTYVHVALGVWPLLVRRLSVRSILVGAVQAGLLAFGMNWARLGLHLLFMHAALPVGPAHDIPYWGGVIAAFAVAAGAALKGLRSPSAASRAQHRVGERLHYMASRIGLAMLAFTVGLSVPMPVLTGAWARVFHSLVVPDEAAARWIPSAPRRFGNYEHFTPHLSALRVYDDSAGAPEGEYIYFAYAKVVRIVWAAPGAGRAVVMRWSTPDTYLYVALALWPLLITRWRPWPILRAAVFAAGLAFALNLLRLYAMGALLWYAGLPFGWAHDLPNWTATATAFAIGLWYMWRTARKQIEQRPAPDTAATTRPPAPGHHASG